ncbi:MAG: hypothetical protein E7368_04525 [Clostridiales bacterium]|nr:hypothetical protein [Clostridiales bacterium]
MKRIQSKAGLLKRRVNAVHARAKLVGIVYLFATIALAVVTATLPLVNGTVFSVENKMPIVAFYDGIRDLLALGLGTVFKTPSAILVFLQLLLYLVLLIILLVNVFRALGRLNWLFKRRASYINGFNRNMYAMDSLGKLFSSSLASVIIFYVIFAMFTLPAGEGNAISVGLYGYAFIGVFALIRMVFGGLEGNVPLFTTGGKIIEKKRDHGVLIYLIRNFVQWAVVAGVLFFFIPNSGFGVGLENMLTQIIVEGDKLYLINVQTLPVYTGLVALIGIMVMVKHATASTEYNRECNHTDGMKNFAVFSCIVAIMIGGLIVYPFVGIGLLGDAEATLCMPLLWAAIIALVGFFFDCFCRAKDKRRVEEETDADPVPADEEELEKPNVQTAYTLPVQPQFSYPMFAEGGEEGKLPYQPIFVPVFCAYPPQGGMAMFQPPMPAPAPSNLLPEPSPATAEEEKEEENALNPYKKYIVRCPECGTKLRARDASPYHRCPICDKVFELRKFKTYVEKDFE